MVELAFVVGLSALTYGLAARFNWFESSLGWIHARLGSAQADALIPSGVVLALGLSLFAWRRWRQSDADAISHHQVQEALRLQSAAVTAAANAVVITDHDGTIVWANPAFTELSGYTFAEAVGKNPRDLVKSGEQERATYQELWETIMAGRVWHGVLVNRRKNGRTYYEEQTITPVRDADGPITHFIAIKQDLSALKRVERALGESERKFQAIFEQAAVGVLITEGSQGQFIRNVNRRLGEMLGYTPDELVDLTSSDICHPDDAADDVNEIQQISFGARREFSREKRYRRKDGSFFWAQAFVAPLDPSEAMPSLRINVIVDIDERKRAQEAVLFKNILLSTQQEASIEAILVVDDQGRILSCNRRFLELWGVPADLVEARADEPVLAYVTRQQTDPELFLRRIRHLNEHRDETGHDELILTDGRFVDRYTSPMLGPEGRYYGRVWYFRDVTEKKKAENTLRLFRALIDRSNDAVQVVDFHTMRFVDVNLTACQALGYTRAEMLDRTVLDVSAKFNHATFEAMNVELKKNGHLTREDVHRRKDGTTFPVEVGLSLINLDRNYVLAIARDITEKKELEKKFLQAQRLESLGMLAAGIAHDLNNVLAPIVFAAPMLRESVSTADDLKILDMLEHSAARGAGLVKQILGFAHGTVGEFRPTQVKHLARDIVSVLEQTLPKAIRIEHRIPPDLWLTSCNPTQIHQVLLNLCINARDAMPEGGTLRITASNRRLGEEEARALSGARPGSWIVLEVADTGTGIPADVLPQIWDPFFTTKSPENGTGLGLSTVRGIVANHRGFITLNTEPYRGTTFSVFLPASPEESPAPAVKGAAAVPNGNNELILVVDDDGSIRDTITAVLTRHNYRTLSAGNGAEALGVFNTFSHEIALVITDIEMPYIGGAALARILTVQRPGLRVLGISGMTASKSSSDEFDAARKLAQAFLAKPFSPEALLHTMGGLLKPKDKP